MMGFSRPIRKLHQQCKADEHQIGERARINDKPFLADGSHVYKIMVKHILFLDKNRECK
jgi:hypothetical protein